MSYYKVGFIHREEEQRWESFVESYFVVVVNIFPYLIVHRRTKVCF